MDIEMIMNIARSLPDGPRGKYIGAVARGDTTYFLYKDNGDYYYETDYDRRRRKELKNANARSRYLR